MKFLKKIILINSIAFAFILAGCASTINSQTTESISESSSEYEFESSSIQSEIISIKNLDFDGVTFKSKSFTYDGIEHFIYVDGAPDFANVDYVNNGRTEVGEQIVEATISASGYNTMILSAKLTIEALTFKNITFSNHTVEYDGEPHALKVDGAPDFATIIYNNNDKIEIGTYQVEAVISADHYKTLKLYANLTIEPRQFKGITFNDQTIAYDGQYHSIYVEGAPDFATVKYENNRNKLKGIYEVKATISADHYKTLVLTAKMTIVNALPKAILEDRTLIYSGNNQRIVYTLPNNLPSYTEISFKVDGKVVSEENFAIKTIGEHVASITLTNTYYDYSPSTVTAKINVIENNIGGVDTSKTSLTINNNLKYKDLRSKILKGNFTIKEEYFDDYFYPDGSTESKLSSTKYTFVSDNEAFEYFSYSEYYQLVDNQSKYRHTKLIENEVRSAYFSDGVLNGDPWEESYKMKDIYYQENIVGRIGLSVIAWLKEGKDGGFINGEEGGYHTTYGSFKIEPINNMFIEDVRIHYYHPEFDHDEHTRYTIYNIGNTVINVPEAFDVSKINTNFENINEIFINGLSYACYEDKAYLYPIMDARSVAYLPSGTYVIPALVNDLPITNFSNGYYSPYFNNDCSGYTFKVYFDKYGTYCGEYTSLGSISHYQEIYELIDDGATVLFYGEW